MDDIWMSRNKFIHGSVRPDAHTCLHGINVSFRKHLKAWKNKNAQALPAAWLPPPLGSFKINFNVVIGPLFSVASAVLSNHPGWIVIACTQRLPPTKVSFGEATAALLGIHIALLFGYLFIMLEGSSTKGISSIDCWPSAATQNFNLWIASKVSRCANSCTHMDAKWAFSHLVFKKFLFPFFFEN